MTKFTILFFILTALAIVIAQSGDYSHFVGGNNNRAGWHNINSFTAWDGGNNRYKDLPSAVFTGSAGPRAVYASAAVGNGVMVVGDFTQVNGIPAIGLAYFNGTNWCGFPHLSLYYYQTPNPPDISNPGNLVNVFPLPNRGFSYGTATGIQVVNGQIYIFGGLKNGQPRFNQLGLNSGSSATNVGYAGLVRLNVVGGGTNFTVDTSFNSFTTQGGVTTGQTRQYNGVGFPADSAPTVSDGTIPKFRVSTTNPPYIYAATSAGSLLVWTPGYGSWLNPYNQFVTNPANVSGVTGPVIFTQNSSPAAVGQIMDWDIDPATNTLFVVGFLNNTANTNSNQQYFHVTSTVIPAVTGTTPSITWGVAANFATNGFLRDGFKTGVTSIAVNSKSNFYIVAAYTNIGIAANQNNRLSTSACAQNLIFSVDGSGNIVQLGQRFQKTASVSYYNGQVYAIVGPNALYNQYFSSVDYSPSRYIRELSPIVTYTGGDWYDAYGGFLTGGDAVYLIAYNSQANLHFIYNSGANSAFDIWTNGLVAFNQNANIKRWYNAANFRFTLRETTMASAGTDGVVNTVHFLQNQRAGVTDAVIVAGQFDWFGLQYYGSIAFLHTSSILSGTLSYESCGGGLWDLALNPLYAIDQDLPVLSAGIVYKIEEANGKIYAGGKFSKNSNLDCLSNIAALNYQSSSNIWYSLGSGCDNVVWDVLQFGGNIYAGGQFGNCGGVPGTRAIAYWNENTNPPSWNALDTGIPGALSTTAKVYAMEVFQGSLYVGGSFPASPASIRSTKTGIYRWDGSTWFPVLAVCEQTCSITYLEAPFQVTSNTAYDPAVRTISDAKSLRSFSGTLYVLGSASTGDVLVGYDGSSWRQFGAASGSCTKQGCLSRNNSLLMGVNFNENGGTYNPNYQAWDKSKNNFVETFNGFDGGVVFIASANIYTFSLILALLSLIALLF